MFFQNVNFPLILAFKIFAAVLAFHNSNWFSYLKILSVFIDIEKHVKIYMFEDFKQCWCYKMKFVICQTSGEMEKLHAMASLAGGATAMDMEVYIFLAMDALTAFKKEVVEKRAWKTNGEVGEALLKSDMPTFIDYLKEAKETGKVKLYACEATMTLLGLSKEDLSDVIDEVTGLIGFFEIAAGGQLITL